MADSPGSSTTYIFFAKKDCLLTSGLEAKQGWKENQ